MSSSSHPKPWWHLDYRPIRIHAESTAGALGVFRFLVFAIWFSHFWFFDSTVPGRLPRELVEPAGLMAWFPAGWWSVLLSAEWLTGLRWVGLLATGAAALGVRPFPWVAIPALVAIVLYDGLAKSFGGFVNHAQFASLYAAFLLMLFPSADGFSILGRSKEQCSGRLYAAPLLLSALVLACAYMFVATARLTIRGLDVFLDESLRTWVVMRTLEGTNFAFQHGIDATDSLLLYRGMLIGFAVVTLCELLAPLAVFHRGIRCFWLVVMIPFHVMSLFTMNIFFWENLLIILALFTPLCMWVAGWRSARGEAPT